LDIPFILFKKAKVDRKEHQLIFSPILTKAADSIHFSLSITKLELAKHIKRYIPTCFSLCVLLSGLWGNESTLCNFLLMFSPPERREKSCFYYLIIVSKTNSKERTKYRPVVYTYRAFLMNNTPIMLHFKAIML